MSDHDRDCKMRGSYTCPCCGRRITPAARPGRGTGSLPDKTLDDALRVRPPATRDLLDDEYEDDAHPLDDGKPLL